MPEILTDLKARKEKLLSTRHLDVKVDGWDDDGEPPVYVRYGTVTNATIEAGEKAVTDAKDAPAKLAANAQVLVAACQGVFQKVDGKRVGFDPAKPDAWPRFDKDLAKILGLAGEPPSALICQALFLSEGNLLAHVGAVAVFSGQKIAEVDTELLGE
jgi:hypothetical protein